MMAKTSFIICTLLLSQFSFSQVLSLEDIFKIHSFDSISLKQFSIERNFKLVMIDEDDWVLDYGFQSNDDGKISFYRFFPKGDAASPGVSYYFNDKKLFKSFEDSIKARGYTRFKYKRYPGETRTKTFVHDILEYEFHLSKPKNYPSKYAIALTFSPQ